MYEAAVCIVGSQTAYELAVATADHLRHSGLFQFLGPGFDRAGYEACIVSALSDPVVVLSPDGIARWMRPRFHRRSASLLATTRANIHGAGMSVKELLLTPVSAKDARQLLVRQVSGFDPKQAACSCGELASALTSLSWMFILLIICGLPGVSRINQRSSRVYLFMNMLKIVLSNCRHVWVFSRMCRSCNLAYDEGSEA